MVATVTHILPLAAIRWKRLLPLPGRVLVRAGQKVNPSDVIAQANLAPEHLILDVARALGSVREKADKYIQRKAGEEVSEGDVIAGPAGFPRRVLRAPASAKIILAGGGSVVLELNKAPFELRAGLPGVVDELLDDRGAVVKSTGALVQGVWGNGGLDFGLMRVLVEKREDQLTGDQLDVGLRGSIILGGYCGDAQVLQIAADLPVRGLILGSMASSLVPLAIQMNYPVLVLDGFGVLPMNSVAFNLLANHDRREVAVKADPFDRYANTRPEIVLPLPAETEPPETNGVAAYAPDQRVRIIRSPHRTAIAKIIAIRAAPERFASGIRAMAADVRLETGENLVVPLANLEILN